MVAMKQIYNDGGRSLTGFKSVTGDCVVRAVAIATEQQYQTVYDVLSHGMRSQRKSNRYRTVRGASKGVTVNRKWFRDYMMGLGWEWTPTMGIGSGCKVHLNSSELPDGRLIVRVSRHVVAVIDGVVHDTFKPDRNGTRCVYGYWSGSDLALNPS